MSARREYLIDEEVKRLRASLGNMPGKRVRAVTPVARRMLLDGAYWYNGRRRNPIAKSVGAGVYEIWIENEEERRAHGVSKDGAD